MLQHREIVFKNENNAIPFNRIILCKRKYMQKLWNSSFCKETSILDLIMLFIDSMLKHWTTQLQKVPEFNLMPCASLCLNWTTIECRQFNIVTIHHSVLIYFSTFSRWLTKQYSKQGCPDYLLAIHSNNLFNVFRFIW